MSAKRRVYAQTETNGLFLFAVSAALEDAEVSCSAAILNETEVFPFDLVIPFLPPSTGDG